MTLAPRTSASSRMETVTLMTPDLANFGGSVHGGHVLRLIDQIAYACASSYSGRYCVTRSVDKVAFRVPVRVGELLVLRAQVNHVGTTSMEVGVRAEARDLRDGTVRHTNSCYLTMVAVDDARRPTPVPPLVVESDEEQRRQAAAALRRRRTRLAEEIDAEEARFQALIEGTPVPVLLLDAATGQVEDANPAASALLGRDEAALRRLTADELLAPAAAGGGRALRDEVLRLGFAEAELLHLAGDGSPRPLRVTAWLLPRPGRRLVQQVLRPVPVA